MRRLVLGHAKIFWCLPNPSRKKQDHGFGIPFAFCLNLSLGRRDYPLRVPPMNPNQFSKLRTLKVSVLSSRAPARLGRRILAPTMIAVGMSLTIAWVAFLGYKLISTVAPPLLFSIIG